MNGAKRNLAYIQHLLSYYCVVSLCETWLLESEVNLFLKSLNNNFVIIQKADMLYAPISAWIDDIPHKNIDYISS